MKHKIIIFSILSVAAFSVFNSAYAENISNEIKEPGISSYTISKVENNISNDDINVINELAYSEKGAVDSIYLRGNELILLTHIDDKYDSLTQNDLDSGAKSAVNEVNQLFCTFDQKYPKSYQHFKNYQYDIVVTSSDNIYLGEIQVKPTDLDCSAIKTQSDNLK